MYCGSVISIEKRSSIQPRPIDPYGSSAACVRPQRVELIARPLAGLAQRGESGQPRPVDVSTAS